MMTHKVPNEVVNCRVIYQMKDSVILSVHSFPQREHCIILFHNLKQKTEFIFDKFIILITSHNGLIFLLFIYFIKKKTKNNLFRKH